MACEMWYQSTSVLLWSRSWGSTTSLSLPQSSFFILNSICDAVSCFTLLIVLATDNLDCLSLMNWILSENVLLHSPEVIWWVQIVANEEYPSIPFWSINMELLCICRCANLCLKDAEFNATQQGVYISEGQHQPEYQFYINIKQLASQKGISMTVNESESNDNNLSS